MKIERPIFICGFAGGGTGILWDLILSHPDCSHPGWETNEIFYANALREINKRLYLTLCSLKYGFNPLFLRIFNTKTDHVMYAVEKLTRYKEFIRFVDERFYQLKLRDIDSPADRFKYRGVPYTRDEIEKTRLVAKNIEGCCFASDFLAKVYPDSKFVSIVRNGLVYCESKMRHNRVRTAREAALIYRNVGNYILSMERKDSNHLTIKYEDMVSAPLKTIERVYSHCELNLDVREFKIMTRSYLGQSLDDSRIIGKKYWYSSAELPSFFDANIDIRAMNRLSDDQKIEFLTIAKDVMDKFGYGSPEQAGQPQ